MNVGIYENVIKEIDKYVEDILEKGFEDIQLEEGLFKNIQVRQIDELVMFLHKKYPRINAIKHFSITFLFTNISFFFTMHMFFLFCCCDGIGCWKIGSLHLSSDREAAPMFLEKQYLFFYHQWKNTMFWKEIKLITEELKMHFIQ